MAESDKPSRPSEPSKAAAVETVKEDSPELNDKGSDATKKPVTDVKSDELSDTDVAKVTGAWGLESSTLARNE